MTDTSTLAVVEPDQSGLQQVAINNMLQVRNTTLEFFQKVMIPNVDWGVIKGNKSLYQPGAEKLARFFKFSVEKELVKEVTNFDTGFIYYKYKTTVKRQDGTIVTQMERSCNSFEAKYSKYSIEKKIGEMYVIEAMAQKRSFVSAIREATMATTIFTDKVIEPEEIESELRKSLNARFFICATERGFTPEGAKASLKRKHQVESFNDLTDQEIEDGITFLESSYEKVGKGNKPQEINSNPKTEGQTMVSENDRRSKSESGQNSTNNVQVLERSDDSDVDKGIVAEKGEIIEDEPEIIECKTCDSKIDKENAHLGKFCNTECAKKYWSKK